MTRRVSMVVSAACLIAALQPIAAAAYPPKPGNPHPNFALPAIGDGKAVSLSQFRGRKVLLINFASW